MMQRLRLFVRLPTTKQTACDRHVANKKMRAAAVAKLLGCPERREGISNFSYSTATITLRQVASHCFVLLQDPNKVYKNMFATLDQLGGINCTSKRELLASYRP
jgi:hypothetical protein